MARYQKLGSVMKIQHKIVGVSIIVGAFIWMIDAVLDFYFFHEGPFLEVLVYDVHPSSLYKISRYRIFSYFWNHNRKSYGFAQKGK